MLDSAALLYSSFERNQSFRYHLSPLKYLIIKIHKQPNAHSTTLPLITAINRFGGCVSMGVGVLVCEKLCQMCTVALFLKKKLFKRSRPSSLWLL